MCVCVTRVLHKAKNSIVNIFTPYPYTNSIIFPLTQTGSGPSVEIRIRIHRINFQSPTRWVSLKTQSSCFTYLPSSSLCTTRARLCHACLHDLTDWPTFCWILKEFISSFVKREAVYQSVTIWVARYGWQFECGLICFLVPLSWGEPKGYEVNGE